MHRALAAGVEDVHEVTTGRDADRQQPSGPHDLTLVQLGALDLEDRHGVAAGVDGEEHPTVVDQGSLRRQRVERGSDGEPTEPAGLVLAGLGEAAVLVAVVHLDGVALGLVGLDEDRALVAVVVVTSPTVVVVPRAAAVGEGGPGGRTDAGQAGQEGCCERHAALHQWLLTHTMG
ncbi:hypothetical protein [Micromonospora luteifusca]|uniref:hypothetical protein n=1 Tax=Micromonospora luteifusca TaxID=709860 RepID=UPI0033AB728B